MRLIKLRTYSDGTESDEVYVNPSAITRISRIQWTDGDGVMHYRTVLHFDANNRVEVMNALEHVIDMLSFD